MRKVAAPPSFAERLPAYRKRVEAWLDARLPAPEAPAGRLHEAVRYALLGKGKRMRPLLLYAAGEVCGLDAEQLDPAAAALEAIHTYSLVHDDLPDMDDDDLRRGRPTVHLAYDPATAILVGDALQSWAFGQLAEAAPEVGRAWLRLLAEASGALGMCAGQQLDMAGEHRSLSLSELRQLHRLKTGALISAAVMMAAACRTDLDEQTTGALQLYAEKAGLAFQIHDDVLDVALESGQLGKPQGSDSRRGKATFVSLLGLEAAQREAEATHREACDALRPLGARAEPLLYLADYIIRRNH